MAIDVFSLPCELTINQLSMFISSWAAMFSFLLVVRGRLPRIHRGTLGCFRMLGGGSKVNVTAEVCVFIGAGL